MEKLKSHKKKCPQRQVVSKGRGMEVDDFLYDMFLDSSTVYVSGIWGFDMKGSSDGFSPHLDISQARYLPSKHHNAGS